MGKNDEYDEVLPYSEGRAAVRKGVLWGYIDENGNQFGFCDNCRGVLHTPCTLPLEPHDTNTAATALQNRAFRAYAIRPYDGANR